MTFVPTPDMYENWQEWASALVEALEGGEEVTLLPLPAYTVADLPPPAEGALLVYVLDETGGAIPAFSDGTDWRRVTDRVIVS